METVNLNALNAEIGGINEIEAIRLLEKEGRRLEKIATRIWRETMAQYSPKVYAVHLTGKMGVRTNRSLDAIKLGKVKKLAGNNLGIELTWRNNLVYHDSVMKNGRKGHSVMLISDGWHSEKLESKLGVIPRFTRFSGTGYIHKVLSEYRRTAPDGVTLELQWSGRYLD